MAPESGSGPSAENPPRPPIDGWRPLPDGSEAANDVQLDAAPTSRAARVLRQDLARLESDASTRAAIDELWRRWRRPLEQAIVFVEEGHPERAEFLDAVLDQFGQHAARLAQSCGPADIRVGTRLGFLTAAVAPDPIRDYLIDRQTLSAPVTIRANRTGRPLPMPDLAHGEIVVRFTRASRRERGAYDTPIENMQQEMGHVERKDKGSRPSIDEDPAKAEQAKAAFKLAWMGLSTTEIAAFFGWEGTEKANEKRVSEYVDVGIRLMSTDQRSWPAGRPVPRLRQPRRQLDWPPDG